MFWFIVGICLTLGLGGYIFLNFDTGDHSHGLNATVVTVWGFLIAFVVIIIVGQAATRAQEQQETVAAQKSISRSESRKNESIRADTEDDSSSSSVDDDTSSASSSTEVAAESATSSYSATSSSASYVDDNETENGNGNRYAQQRADDGSAPNRSYESKPVPNTSDDEIVYVNLAIPGRYHKDPNCRGLQRYGGGTAMTLTEAANQGYGAFCAYERYGN